MRLTFWPVNTDVKIMAWCAQRAAVLDIQSVHANAHTLHRVHQIHGSILL